MTSKTINKRKDRQHGSADEQKLDWPLGIASQLAFNVAVILLAVELQM